jgi:hypothetical protein
MADDPLDDAIRGFAVAAKASGRKPGVAADEQPQAAHRALTDAIAAQENVAGHRWPPALRDVCPMKSRCRDVLRFPALTPSRRSRRPSIAP